MTKSHNRSSLWSVWCLVMVLLLVSHLDGCDGWGKTMAEEGDATTAESTTTTTTTTTATAPHHTTPEEQASMLNQVDIAAQLKDQSLNAISSEDALAIAGLLDALMSDAETQSMVRNLKATTDGGDASDQDNPQLQAFVQDATPSEIAMGMVQLLEELRGLNYLYSKLDPARAVEEMYHDGMVDDSNVDYFRSHPEQLPLQIESGLYFSFVTLAVAGGYL